MGALDLQQAYDVEGFRALGRQLVDALADHLAKTGAREGMPVLPTGTPTELVTRFAPVFPAIAPDPMALVRRVVEASNHLHHPRYVGHQVTAPLPLAALGELVSAFLNNSMAVFEMGPAGTAIERAVIAWMASALGFHVREAGEAAKAGGAGELGAEGVLTSGGSLGNLTAMLAARKAMARLHETDAPGEKLAVITASQAHYSIRRSVDMMGFGEGGLILAAVDERFRLDVGALEAAFAEAERRGRRVIAVAASACSTATGAFDPIDEIADFLAARRERTWLHVDGAHGAVASLSPLHRHLVKGIARADSVVWDAHKMMLMPSLVTAVIFRDGDRSFDVFAQQASYLFEGQTPRDEWWNTAVRTVECTKKMMGLPLHLCLSTYGPGIFVEYVDRTFALARDFAAMLTEAGDFEVATEPQCNIVCFRLLVPGVDGAALDRLQKEVRARIVASGAFYLVSTGLPRGTYLRVTIINPRTTADDLRALADSVRETAREIAQDSKRSDVAP